MPPPNSHWHTLVQRIAIALAFILLSGIAWQSYSSTRNLAHRDRGATQTQQALAELEHLQSTLKDAVIAQRSYLLSGDSRFLESYRRAQQVTPAVLERLRGLTIEDSLQQQRLATLEELIAARMRDLSAALEARRANAEWTCTADDLVRAEQSMEELRIVFAQTAEEERFQYVSRRREQDLAIEWAGITVSVGSVVTLMFVAVIFLIMSRENQRRRGAEAALWRLNAELGERVCKATHELRAAADRSRLDSEAMAAVINQTAIPIVGVDIDRKVTIWNEAAVRAFGYAAGDVVGSKVPLKLGSGSGGELNRLLDTLLGGQAIRERASTCSGRSGAVLDVIVYGAPLHDTSGAPCGAVLILEDVTRRKVLEQHLRHAQKMDAVGQLTGGVAHDFNNLLGVMIGNLDLVHDHCVDRPEVAALVQDALDAAGRGAELIRRLLAFARRQPLQAQIVDVNKLLPDMVVMLRRILNEAISIEIATGKHLWPALVDPLQVEESIVNLAINARDAMPHGGRLTIATSNVNFDDAYLADSNDVQPGDYVLISVTDEGTGMPQAILEHAFEPFFTTKNNRRNAGLGLSMVYGFVKQSHGHIKIHSELNVGTTVKLYLPRATGDDVTNVARGPERSSILPTGHEIVLVVEDNAFLRRTVVRQLTELGYRVVQADNAETALDILQADPSIGLLFTDVVMPGGANGSELAEEAVRRRPDLKVLLTSGYAQFPVATSNDAPPRLSKPYRKHELARMVRATLDAAPDPDQPT